MKIPSGIRFLFHLIRSVIRFLFHLIRSVIRFPFHLIRSGIRFLFQFDRKDILEWCYRIWLFLLILFTVLYLCSSIFDWQIHHLGISRESFNSIFILLASISSGFLAIFIAMWAFLTQYHLNALRNNRIELSNNMVSINDLVDNNPNSERAMKESISHLNELWFSLSISQREPISASSLDDNINSFATRLGIWQEEIASKLSALRKKQKQSHDVDDVDESPTGGSDTSYISEQIALFNTLDTRGIVVINLTRRIADSIMAFFASKETIKVIWGFAVFVIFVFSLLVINNIDFGNEELPATISSYNSSTTTSNSSTMVENLELGSSSENRTSENTSTNQTQGNNSKRKSLINIFIFDDPFRFYLTILVVVFSLSGLIGMAISAFNICFSIVEREVGKLK